MRRILASILCLALAGSTIAQVAGGAGTYSGGSAQDREELGNRQISAAEMPPPGASYVDAAVLANVKADEYVAVFGLVQEGETPAVCNEKLTATLAKFTASLKGLGISAKDSFVDFIVQNRIYDFDVKDNVAKERLAGFELKKNISIHYRDRDLLDRLVAAAAEAQIYDLIKVDYVVRDTQAVHAKLMKEAAAVVKRKAASLGTVMGLKLSGPTQILAEKYRAHFPTEMYSSYAAAEGEEVTMGYDRSNVIQRARKAKTFYFDPLDAKLFDVVLNPVVLEPVVQFTLYFKVKYDASSGSAVRIKSYGVHK